MMKKLIIGLFALSVNMLPAMAAGPSVPLMEAGNDISDQPSLQRGAKSVSYTHLTLPTNREV